MIRVVVIAGTLQRARSLASLLAENERLDIVRVEGWSRHEDWAPEEVDVIVAAGISRDHLPSEGPPIVVVANSPMEGEHFGHGVRAWLPGDVSASELGAAIEAVANGLSVMTEDQAKHWLRRTGSPEENGSLFIEALTPREVQVLRMVADGLANKEIAGRLGISEHTAKFHVAQILAKLGAGSRTEAVTLGIRRGLLPI